MSFLTKILGDTNKKYLNNIQPLVSKINELEKSFESFSKENLKEKTLELKERLKKESGNLLNYGKYEQLQSTMIFNNIICNYTYCYLPKAKKYSCAN